MKNYPLPVLYMLVSSARLMRDKWRLFLPLSWPYLMVSVISQMGQLHRSMAESFPLLFLYGCVVAVVTAWVTVRLHRAILLNRQSPGTVSGSLAGMREVRVLGYWLVMCVVMIALIICWSALGIMTGMISDQSGSWTQSVAEIALILPMAWLISRWGLVIPATAIDDEPRGLRFAWQLSREHKGALFVLTGIIPIGVGMLISSVSSSGNLATALSLGAFSYLAWTYEICILSLSYQWIVQRQTINQMLQHSQCKLMA